MSPTNLSIRACGHICEGQEVSSTFEVTARLEQYYCCACTEKEEGLPAWDDWCDRCKKFRGRSKP
jgi:hypothetical protein